MERWSAEGHSGLMACRLFINFKLGHKKKVLESVIKLNFRRFCVVLWFTFRSGRSRVAF
jgi:hypothetical protein